MTIYTDEKVDEFRQAFRLSVGITLIFLGIIAFYVNYVVIPKIQSFMIAYHQNPALKNIIEGNMAGL